MRVKGQEGEWPVLREALSVISMQMEREDSLGTRLPAAPHMPTEGLAKGFPCRLRSGLDELSLGISR